MKSALRGKSISEVEVTNVSQHGFWVLVAGRELFLPFEQFPWFKDVSVAQLLNVESPHPTYLRWPDLDVDLAVESIEHPARFPLVSKTRSNSALQRTRARKRSRTPAKQRRARR